MDKQCSTLCFEFFNKIISCGRKGEGQGLGPPLWSVAGEGGLRSGLEGSVSCGSRGSASRPDPAKGGGEEGQNWTERSCHPNNQPSPFLPRLGDGGASSFGLRLRTGDRCSLKGRSERHRKACGRLSACCLSPALRPQRVPVHTHAHTHCCFRASPSPVSSYPSRGCSFGVGTWAKWKGCQTLAPWFLTPHTTSGPLSRPMKGDPEPTLSCTQAPMEVSPHQQGPGAGPHAQTLLVALPREASASAGHLGEARVSGYGPSSCHHSSPCPLPSGSPEELKFPAGTPPVPSPVLGWG